VGAERNEDEDKGARDGEVIGQNSKLTLVLFLLTKFETTNGGSMGVEIQ
jgi:hypothetical protein